MNAATLPHLSLAFAEEARTTRRLRQLIWLYIVLLIFEGAMRKWLLPGLAAPLLIIRDPLAVLMLYVAATSRRYQVLNTYTLVAFVTTIIGFFAALAFGHENLSVASFGAHIMALHFPLIFIFGQALDRDDVLRIGRFIMWLTPPMILLVGLQFYSPQSAWVNRGVGGDMEGAGFSGALGYFRPPGTFSFTLGATLFFDLAAAFVAYFWISSRREIPRLLLLAATVSVLLAISLLLSRGYVFQLGITVIFMLFASLRSGRSVGNIGLVLLFFPLIVMVLLQFEFFQTSLDVISTRFALAGKSEGGVEGTLVNRFLAGNLSAITDDRAGFWGFGLGLGTNVGSVLVGEGGTFLVGENEWQRVIGELGILLGSITVLCRFVLAIHLSLRSFKKVISDDPLCWMLMSFGAVQIIYGQWAPPMVLGFGVLVAGLAIASLNDPKSAA